MMSTEYFKAVIDWVGDPVFAKDRHYKFVFVNDAACEMFGKPRGQVLGKTDYELFPKEQADIFRRHDDCVFETGEADVNEEQITDAQSNDRTIVTKKTLYVSKAGEEYIVGAIRDITERKRAEEALLESEVKYRTIVENSLGGIYIHQDGLFRFVNKRWCEIYGYTHEEIVDKLGPMDITHPADRHVVQGHVTELLTGTLNANRFTHKAIRKDGTTITVNVLGNRMIYRGRPASTGTVYDITEQERAEEQLQQKTALLEAQVNASLDGIIVVDKGKKILQNQQVNDLLKTPGHIAESDDDEAQVAWVKSQAKHPEQFDEKIAYMLAHRGETIRDELEFNDGTVLDTYTRPVIGNDGKHYGRIWTFRDITERKRTEEELQRAHRRLSDIIDFLPDATFVIDREKRVVAWNKAIEEMTGVTKEEILGKGDYAYAVPFYGEPRPIVIDLVLQRNEEMEKIYDHVQREGSKLSMEVYVPKTYRGRGAYLSATASPLFDREGNVVGAIETIRDTTEQKRIEKALQESEERYRTAIESSNDGVALVRGDRHIYVNRKFLEIFGYLSLEEVAGKTLYLTVHPDDREKVVSYNRRRQRGEAVPDRYEFKGLRKDGEVVYIEASATVTTYQGEPVSLVFLRDVTERKSLEVQLRQSQKMEAIGTLAGGVAHDFNNILMVLMGYANLLQMQMGQNDPSRVYVDQILASTAKAANITQSLLVFGSKQTMEMKPHKITTIVKDVEKLLQRLMPEDIELTIKLGDDATVRADMTQIDQVLINLATNARDAMPKGGRLTIETGRVVIDEEFRRTYGYGKPDAYALILVTDTGMGMDEKTQEKIFEPFFTTKELGKGTGLGLSIIYGIIKQHNGYINVSSRPGEGSAFLLYLPEVKETPREARSAVRKAKGGSETLLLAEDNADIRAVMSGILSMSGYTVIEAVNGRDAVEKFSEHKNQIALIILDVVMPEKNGKEAYEEIRTMRHDIKALFMSGYTADIVLDKGVFGEALDYIAKPIAPNDLLHKVRNILDR